MEMRPIAEVLPGMELQTLSEGSVPVEAVVLVRALDETGTPYWATRNSGSISHAEIIGALTMALDFARRDAAESWVIEEEA